MKKKRIIFIIVLLSMFSICTFSYASSEFAGIFTLTNPSATNVAFGLESGTANIWDRNPLGVWSNPAKLGYYNGIAYGYSHDKWFEDVVENMYHNSSYITFGWNGVGILLPNINNSYGFGTTFDYGLQLVCDAQGDTLYQFYSDETCSQFAAGMNLLEFFRNVFPSSFGSKLDNLQKYGEVSLGYSISYIKSYIIPSSESPGCEQGMAHPSNLGLIFHISPINIDNENFKCDLAVGVNFINVLKTKISYMPSDKKWLLPYGNRTGIAGKLSFINIKNLADEYPLFSAFSKNLFSIYASYDNSKYDDNPSTWGKGIELTLLDIFSWRSGEYNDIDGHIVGDCKGWGVNLNYKDVVSFQYNYVEFPGGKLQAKQEKEDISFSVDIIKLINELK